MRYPWIIAAAASLALAACDGIEAPTAPSELKPAFAISPAPAGAIIVNDGGADCPAGAVATYSTIGAAVAAAPRFSTIYVCPGSYPEAVTISDILWVFGPQYDRDARFRSGEPEAVVGAAGGGFRIQSDQVSIRGFTIRNVTGAPGIEASGSLLVIWNNIIEDNTLGIRLETVSPYNSSVFANVFRNNNAPGTDSGWAIYSDQGAFATSISSNSFTGHANGPMTFRGPAGSQSRLSISGNQIDNDGVMEFYRITTLGLEANIITNATGDALLIGGGITTANIYYISFLGGAGTAIRIEDDGSGANSGFYIHDNCFVGNAGALDVSAAAYSGGLYGRRNWWGQASGPDVNGSGPGTGQSVADPDGVVDYSSWQTVAPWGCEAADDEGPLTSAVSASINPVAVGASFDLSALVDDATTGGSEIASAEYSVNGGAWMPLVASDGAFSDVSEYVGGSVTAPAQASVETICVRGADDAGNTGAPECLVVAVYDPSAGFVSGGGWIQSGVGSCQLTAGCAPADGKATFGFVARYQKGASVPTGATQFLFAAAGFQFSSTAYDWLVVSGASARFKGTGTVNGSGDYGFLLTATDGQVNGGGGTDLLRLKVWDRATDQVVYDNQAGDADDAAPVTALGGGSVVVHAN